MDGNAGDIWMRYNDACNAADFATLESLVAPTLAVAINGSAGLGSSDDDVRAIREMFEKYPDYRREVEEVLALDDRATIRWRMHGTPAHPNTPPLHIAGCSIVRVQDGIITEAYLYCDGDGLQKVVNDSRGQEQDSPEL